MNMCDLYGSKVSVWADESPKFWARDMRDAATGNPKWSKKKTGVKLIKYACLSRKYHLLLLNEKNE